MVAFQAVDPGSTPGRRTRNFVLVIANNSRPIPQDEQTDILFSHLPDWKESKFCSSLNSKSTHIPGGLVVRIPRFHRGGRGSIPRLGSHFDHQVLSLSGREFRTKVCDLSFRLEYEICPLGSD